MTNEKDASQGFKKRETRRVARYEAPRRERIEKNVEKPAPAHIQQVYKADDADRKVGQFQHGDARKKMPDQGRRHSTRQRSRMLPTITHLRDDITENVKPRQATKDYIKIIPVGGVEEIGRNMIIVEYGNDMLVFDAGLEFPTSTSHPGVDYIIPNVSYLKKYKHLIRGIVISHGHLDHVGALPFVIEDMGNPPIYTTGFTSAFIKKKHSEFRHLPMPNIIEVKKGDTAKVGKEGLLLRFFEVEHSITDSIGVVVETKFGDIVYPGDFKIERDRNNNPTNVKQYEEIGKRKPLALILESTNIEVPGFSKTDEEVAKGLEEIYKQARGRIITATFSSQIDRVADIAKIAEDLGRHIAIVGFSLKTNLDLARELGIFTPKKNTIIDIKDIDNYPPEKIMVICTGAQGEENAALMRVVNKKHPKLKIQKGDTVVLSSSVIPGNERPVQWLKDNLARQGAKIFHYKTATVHASGHAYRDEAAILHQLVKPKFFIPVHGFYFNLAQHAELAMSLGMPEENIVVPYHNGVVINVNDKKIEMTKDYIPANSIAVDGLGVGDVKEVVLRDRNLLAQDGIFVVFVILDEATGKVKTSPDIISRGFIYLRESQEMLREARNIIRKTIESYTATVRPADVPFLTDQIREKLGKFLFQHTKRRPMVLPVIVQI